MEQLQKLDAEGRERLSRNIALITGLEREVAHWRSRTVLADREWSERHQSLTAERAGMCLLFETCHCVHDTRQVAHNETQPSSMLLGRSGMRSVAWIALRLQS